MYSNYFGECLDECGDGKRFWNSICDDGDKSNGDGCSSKCTVEKNFVCRGGLEKSKDVCSYIKTEFESITI